MTIIKEKKNLMECEIKFTGLKPGEKMERELNYMSSKLRYKTNVQAIKKL